MAAFLALMRALKVPILTVPILLAACQMTPSASQPSDPAAQGQALFTELGCAACHATEPSSTEQRVGPTLAGVYGQEVQLADGRRIVADEAYLRQSILDPDAATVEGYARGVMSAGTTRIRPRLDDPGVTDALIAYLKSLQ